MLLVILTSLVAFLYLPTKYLRSTAILCSIFLVGYFIHLEFLSKVQDDIILFYFSISKFSGLETNAIINNNNKFFIYLITIIYLVFINMDSKFIKRSNATWMTLYLLVAYFILSSENLFFLPILLFVLIIPEFFILDARDELKKYFVFSRLLSVFILLVPFVLISSLIIEKDQIFMLMPSDLAFIKFVYSENYFFSEQTLLFFLLFIFFIVRLPGLPFYSWQSETKFTSKNLFLILGNSLISLFLLKQIFLDRFSEFFLEWNWAILFFFLLSSCYLLLLATAAKTLHKKLIYLSLSQQQVVVLTFFLFRQQDSAMYFIQLIGFIVLLVTAYWLLIRQPKNKILSFILTIFVVFSILALPGSFQFYTYLKLFSIILQEEGFLGIIIMATYFFLLFSFFNSIHKRLDLSFNILLTNNKKTIIPFIIMSFIIESELWKIY